MSDHWKIYMKKFTLAHKHPTIMKEWKAKNVSQWTEYCVQIAALQMKNIDQVSEDDRTMLHDYIFLLTQYEFLPIFSVDCPCWSYVIHLVDSTIIKKYIDQRLSALESMQSTHSHTHSIAGGTIDAHMLLHQLRNM